MGEAQAAKPRLDSYDTEVGCEEVLGVQRHPSQSGGAQEASSGERHGGGVLRHKRDLIL